MPIRRVVAGVQNLHLVIPSLSISKELDCLLPLSCHTVEGD